MRLLMCPPDYFDVSYEINAWMHMAVVPDKSRAWEQWDHLYHTLASQLSVDVSVIHPCPGSPDMVFTANAGMVEGKTFVPSRLRFPERQGETPHFVRWFTAHGYTIVGIPDDIVGCHEGEGDALRYGDLILGGYGHRSDAEPQCAAGVLLGHAVLPLKLIDPRWYHLDTCLAPLSDELIAYYPDAFDQPSVDRIEALPGEKILLSLQDALRFAANAVVVGKHVVLNAGCSEFEGALRGRGFVPHPVPLDEFLKAGGAAKCLVLRL